MFDLHNIRPKGAYSLVSNALRARHSKDWYWNIYLKTPRKTNKHTKTQSTCWAQYILFSNKTNHVNKQVKWTRLSCI